MRDSFQEQLNDLIDSSISIHSHIGQTTFNRLIDLESLGRERITQQLIDGCLGAAQRRNVEIEFCPDFREFALKIDIHLVMMSYSQAKAFAPSLQ